MKNAPQGRFSLADAIPAVVALLFAVGWTVASHFLPWVSWHTELPFFLATLIAAWCALIPLMRGAQRTSVPLPAPVLPFFLLLCLTLVQFGVGQMNFLGDALVFGMYLMLCAMCLVLGFSLTARGRSMDSPWWIGSPLPMLSLALLVGGVASTVVAVAQVLETWETATWILRMSNLRRPGGNLGQPNHLATLLVMAMASAAYLHASKRLSHMVAVTLLVVLSAGMAITESRTGALSLFALLLWWGWKQPRIEPHGSRGWAVMVAVFFVLMFLAWPPLFCAIKETAECDALWRLGARAGNARADVWPQLIEAAMLRPWSGWGIGQTAMAHNAVAHAYSQGAPFSYSHNLVLDLVLWLGWPVAGLLVLATSIWLWRRVCMTHSLDPWYGLAVALPLGVHSMLEYPFAYAYFLAPVMLALGSVESMLGVRPWLRVGVKPAAGVLLLSTVLMAWSVVEYIRVEEDFRVARFEMLRVGQTPADHERPNLVLLTQLGALLESTRVELVPGMPAEQLELLRKVAVHYPWSAPQYRYATALALNGNPAEAARQLHVVRSQLGEKTYFKLRGQLVDKLRVAGIPASLP